MVTERVSVARKYFEYVGSGDMVGMATILAPDIEYHFPGRSPFAKTYHGKEQVFGYLNRLRDVTGGTLKPTVVDLLEGQELVAGLVDVSAARGEHSTSWRLAVFMNIEGGQIRRVVLHYDDQYAVDEFLK